MSYKVRVIKSAAKGVERFDNEANDCTVRALANAYGMPYKLAHRIMGKAGRKQGKGPQLEAMHKTYTRLGFEIDRIHGETNTARYLWKYLAVGHTKYRGATLGRVLPLLSVGRFIVLIRGHVFAVVNGEVLDYGDNLANASVAAVYKLPEQHVLFNQ
jgi:hypothetical protein